VFVRRVRRRIFGPKRDEEIGGCGKIHSEEIHNLYSSTSIIRMIKSRRMRWAWNAVRRGVRRNTYRILVGKPEGIPRRKWEDNIKMDLRERGWGGMDWIDPAQDTDQWTVLMNMVINLRIP
jgi:hypothetical protein